MGAYCSYNCGYTPKITEERLESIHEENLD